MGVELSVGFFVAFFMLLSAFEHGNHNWLLQEQHHGVQQLHHHNKRNTLKKNVSSPPRIVRQSGKEIAYKSEEQVRLECVAKGNPAPEYFWKKDGMTFTVSGVGRRQLPGVGTLVLETPTRSDEGLYQCFAKNAFGTAVSVQTLLREAFMVAFPSVKEVVHHTPEVGRPLTLRCSPPDTYPTGKIYWAEQADQIKPIETSDRVTTDYEGNLRFANVLSSDSIEGKSYVCVVSNSALRGLVQGDDQKVFPKKITACQSLLCAKGVSNFDLSAESSPATPSNMKPALMWQSETPTIALTGSEKHMKCIFSGYPTPKVTWERVDKNMDKKVKFDENNLEIVIPNISYDDKGRYKCTARNIAGEMSREFELNVESMPLWVTEPEDVNTSVEEDAMFTCESGGIPKPKQSWLVNGVPISELAPDPRRTVTETTLSYKNLSESDAQVIQCNATNKHGYIFRNAYLNVLAEAPSFIKFPEAVTKVAETQTGTISCQVFGAPKPKIKWTKDGSEQPLEPSRFQLKKSGDLFINGVQKGDSGSYNCHAFNKFGEVNFAGQLLVREKTRITKVPVSQTVNASSNVIFKCEATTDPDEIMQLSVQWQRDGKPIDYMSENRISKNTIDNSLRISMATVADSALYTCVATTKLDSEEKSANLIVKDRPGPPADVRLDDCRSSNVMVSWEPGPENNEPIIEYIVYYSTSFDEPGVYHQHANVPRGTTNVRIPLSPWANYTFHVRARNSLGISDRSAPTPGLCSTSPSIPLKNPSNVCTESRDPSQLVIVWNPMKPIDHNGPGFHYLVSYRRVDIPGSAAPEIKEKIFTWSTRELVIREQETFRKYEIKVIAVNSEGEAPRSVLTPKFGYSGEDTPLDKPKDFRIDDSSLNASSAVFLWESVDDNPDRIRGHFRGYRIMYWRSEDPSRIREHDVLAGDFNPCPNAIANKRRRRQAGREVTGHVFDLWPYSKIVAGVLVLNGGKAGKLSDTITFQTPEGFPGPVPIFEVFERGSHHIRVRWSAPLNPNGVILGYVISYRKTGTGDSPSEASRPGAAELKTNVRNLQPNTKYTFFITAFTSAGIGLPRSVESETRSNMPPDVPGVAHIEPSDNSFNVSWIPTAENERKTNPGNEFYVEYRRTDSDPDTPWEKTSAEDNQNWVNVSQLKNGKTYEVRVVAVNGVGEESRSKPKEVIVGPKNGGIIVVKAKDAATAAAGSPVWFIALMCAIVFLLLILIIVCLIKRNRGGKYPVHEKEKLRGRDLDKDEEAGFGEYTRAPYTELKSDDPIVKNRTGSSNSDNRSLDSESDSMAEYDDPDTGKFNEDGSFIGQYGAKMNGSTFHDKDIHSPPPLSTFV